MLNYRVDGTSMEEALSEDNFDFCFLLSKNSALVFLISPFILICEVVMMILLTELLHGTIQMFTVI
jgi:hypothetical protein